MPAADHGKMGLTPFSAEHSCGSDETSLEIVLKKQKKKTSIFNFTYHKTHGIQSHEYFGTRFYTLHTSSLHIPLLEDTQSSFLFQIDKLPRVCGE